MPAVRGGVAAPAAGDGVPVFSATRGSVKGLRGCALEAPAGDGGVGRDRIPIAPGSVTFGDRGDFCVRARNFHAGSVGELRAGDDLLSRSLLGVAVDTWRSERARVKSMASSGSASLDWLASAGSSLLQQCHGSVASVTAAVGSSCLAPHIHCDIVRHWFGIVKKFLLFLYCFVCYHLARRCASHGGGICLRSLRMVIIPASPLMMPLFTTRCAPTLYTGVPWFLIRVSRPKFWGLGCRLWPLSSEPKIRIIHDLTFARDGDRTSVNDDTDFSSAPPCELRHVLRDVLLRALYFRQRHGSTARILLCRVDIKDAFRQVPVDPAGPPAVGYVVGGHVVVDLRLQFG